ncbi:MAG: NADH-quinone oxidoreductase subunit NuoH [Bacteroidetes bacterium]|nr:NADH-quinone oxidoreductase subunit NuoH [Bacteroidota bacterium]
MILRVGEAILPPSLIPLLSILISVTAIVLIAPVIMMYLTWLERKVIARMQNRIGPNRVGKFGLLQPLADGIKMLIKEDIVPLPADRFVHFLAPVAVVVPSLLLFAVLPFGRNMTAANLDIGLLFFLAVSSIGTLAIFMGGWGSRNKFSLLGAMRALAQMVSYEVPLILSVVPVVMIAGSLSTVKIVEAQGGWGGLKWFVFTPWGLVGFIIFFIGSVAEVNRTPFDIPEGESEIVAGFHTEYSGMKFAIFFLAEYANMFAVSAIVVVLFFGGYLSPIGYLGNTLGLLWLIPVEQLLWFTFKGVAFVLVQMWLRWTLPRLRVDQLMAICWKYLIPIAFVNLLIVGLITLI